ncbi:MAG: hypothetical protein ACKO96_48735 [Flammeovirgaceae bacterium]
MKYILLMFFLMPQLVCGQAAQQKPTKLSRKTTPKVITQQLDTIKQKVKQNVIKKSEMVKGGKASLNAISPKKKTDYAESDELKANAIKDINNTKKSLQEKSEQALERSKQVRHSFDTPKDEWKSMTKKLRDSVSRGELMRIVESEGKTRLSQSKEQIKGYGKQAKELKSEFKKPIQADFKLDNNGSSASSENLNSLKSAIDAVQKTNGLPPNSNGVDKTDFPPPSNLLKKDGTLPSINEPLNIESPATNLKNDLLKLPQQKMDSLSHLNLKNAFDVFPNFVGTTKVLSEKRLRQLKDSLGGKKFDSLFNIGQQLVRKKEIGREDLLKYINSPVAKEAAITPSQNFDQNTVTEEIKTKTQDDIKDFNLHELELPRADLEKLPPLSGNILDSKYVRMLDSLKNKSLSKQDMSLLEKKLDKRYSEVIFKNKPKFWDKGYFVEFLFE